MSTQTPNDKTRIEEEAATKVERSVDTTNSPRLDDLAESDRPAHVDEGGVHDPDRLAGGPDNDPYAGQVGPDNIGNTGISKRRPSGN